ncbi:MAG: iron-sulfur cluster repair di-iron protein [Syntrophaceae bacterium PtaB.Bin095]|jgi:hemerythrin-like domain-containing protein|nr:MAG: iron-sulfur cluster repair di-iron protein [Syntrophaceae bacterium PtaB.Bin095]
MERASQDLMHEHDAILFSLKVLEEICNRVESRKDVLIKDIASLIEFLKLFADKCHHGKEEGFLFPALIEAGIPAEKGPIDVMLAEHTMGRNYIRQIQESATDKAFRTEEFGKSARGYISLMRAHIQKENNVLFPMGDAKLSDSKQRELIESFEKYEEEVIGKGKHEELHKQLEAFNTKFLKSSVQTF